MRNQIYSLALVQSGPLTITAKGPGEPALLRVCNGIRKEASSVYYTANDFELLMDEYNGAALTPFYGQYRRHEFNRSLEKSENGNVVMMLRGPPNFKNLVAWIKDYHLWTNRLAPVLDNPYGASDYIVKAAFDIEKAMIRCTWSEVEKALQAMQHAMKGTCSPWGRDEDDEHDDEFH